MTFFEETRNIRLNWWDDNGFLCVRYMGNIAKIMTEVPHRRQKSSIELSRCDTDHRAGGGYLPTRWSCWGLSHTCIVLRRLARSSLCTAAVACLPVAPQTPCTTSPTTHKKRHQRRWDKCICVCLSVSTLFAIYPNVNTSWSTETASAIINCGQFGW